MTEEVDPLNAGKLVIGAIVRAVTEEPPASYSPALREKLSQRDSSRGQMLVDTLVTRLTPGDMTQTEHIILFDAIRRLRAEGHIVTLPAIQDALIPNDPAQFCLITLEQIARRRDSFLTDQTSIEILIEILLKERSRRAAAIVPPTTKTTERDSG